MKDETAGVAIEEFVGLKRKIYSYLVDYNSEHEKAMGINKNVVATILRHTMNRIQSKDHRIGTYEINKISLSCFDDKIYIHLMECLLINTDHPRLNKNKQSLPSELCDS